MLNSSQSMVASYRYDPFGNTISSGGTIASANVYRFSSKEIHVNSGMYYYGYRFYDPNLQRWINSDPMEDLNLFRHFTTLRVVAFRSESPSDSSYAQKQCFANFYANTKFSCHQLSSVKAAEKGVRVWLHGSGKL